MPMVPVCEQPILWQTSFRFIRGNGFRVSWLFLGFRAEVV